MAKSREGTKSQAISKYLVTNKGASPKQIVAALKEEGVEVSFGLASAVKYGTKNKKKGLAKMANRTVRIMAAPPVSMSASIRQFIAKNRNATPKEIEAGLKADGIKVKMGLINAVKYANAKKGNRKKRVTTPVMHAAARAVRVSSLGFEQLVAVKILTDSLGGADQVRRALDALAQLQ